MAAVRESSANHLKLGVLALAIGGAFYAACNVDAGSLSDAGCFDGSATPSTAALYTAFEPTHRYRVPAALIDAFEGAVRWSIEDTRVAALEAPAGQAPAMLAARQSGTTAVTARGEGRCGLAQVHVTPATPQDWLLGETIYNSRGMPSACADCHGPTATNAFRASVPTPTQTATFSDAELGALIRRGEYPEHGQYDARLVPRDVFAMMHRFALTDDAMHAVIVYLRSLPPSPQPSDTAAAPLDPSGRL